MLISTVYLDGADHKKDGAVVEIKENISTEALLEAFAKYGAEASSFDANYVLRLFENVDPPLSDAHVKEIFKIATDAILSKELNEPQWNNVPAKQRLEKLDAYRKVAQWAKARLETHVEVEVHPEESHLSPELQQEQITWLEISQEASTWLQSQGVNSVRDLVSEEAIQKLSSRETRDNFDVTYRYRQEVCRAFEEQGLGVWAGRYAGSIDVTKIQEMSLEEMDFSVRTYNCLRKAGVANLAGLVACTEQELRNIRNFGSRSLNEVKAFLSLGGLSLWSTDESDNRSNAPIEE